jgi:DNA primase
VDSSEPIDPDALAYDSFLPPFALEYLRKRKINSASISAWELGWLPDEQRIVIPAHDLNGHIRFLIQRAVKERDHPKYLYTEGFPKTSLLFGACRIDLKMLRSVGLILEEGSIDAIRTHQHGLRIATAILGTGISEAQRRIIAKLRPPRIYFMFDKDTSGIKNIEIAAEKLRKYPIFVCRYPKGVSDPADMTRREAYRSIENALPLYKFKQRLQSMGIPFGPNADRYREVTYG